MNYCWETEAKVKVDMSSVTELEIKTTPMINEYAISWDHSLGTGVSGPVRLCTELSSGSKFAVKCIPDSSKARLEVQIHWLCRSHPNIVDVKAVYCNKIRFPEEASHKSRLLIVLELMKGGELFDEISKQKNFTERKAADYLLQIGKAVLHCHSSNIAHRDLKPENLLLSDKSNNAILKLSDFGFAKFDNGDLKTPYFTPYYVAPQVLEAHIQKKKKITDSKLARTKPCTYDKSCDMWSIGVILYIMLCGYPPFYSETPNNHLSSKMRKKILSGDYEFPQDDWGQISEEAKDVIRRLLHTDPSQRMTIDELIVHPWLSSPSDSQLKSPVILTDKAALEDAQLAHGEALMVMRLNSTKLCLKPLSSANNSIIKKRLGSKPYEKTSEEQPVKNPIV